MNELFHKYRVFMETHKKAIEEGKMLLTAKPTQGHKDDALRCHIRRWWQTVINCQSCC
jgi:hypothetical protein